MKKGKIFRENEAESVKLHCSDTILELEIEMKETKKMIEKSLLE